MVMLEIVQIPALTDNYIYLAHAGAETAVIDPSVAEPVLAEAARRGWTITQIINTHWHADHTGGNAAIKAATGARITGPAGEQAKIADMDRAVVEGDSVAVGGVSGRVIDVSGHTAGHNAYYFDGGGKDGAGVLFCGDTLFALGCGRLFEGTATQMSASLAKLMALPDDTLVYCAHEYTASNARYAATVEPDNVILADRIVDITRRRAAGLPTVPSTIGLERATNPFTRAASVAEFAARRTAKDNFR